MTVQWPHADEADGDTPAERVRRAVIDAGNRGSLATLDDLLTDGGSEWVQHLLALVSGFRAAVPEAHWTVEEQIAQGEVVVTRLCVEGRFSGPLLGLAPPGRWACVSAVLITHFEQGRLIDVWLQADLLGLLCQLGVMPQLELWQALTVARVARAGEAWMDT